jgi:hypothetical protein
MNPARKALTRAVNRAISSGASPIIEQPAPHVVAELSARDLGKRDYEADCARQPLYHDGTPRPAWERLPALTQWTWWKVHFPQ